MVLLVETELVDRDLLEVAVTIMHKVVEVEVLERLEIQMEMDTVETVYQTV